jgi:SWI/SNF related-matrix-associated actin-dependent regulator of chromatin subfamily C
VDPESRPTAIGPPFTGHFRVSADTPRGVQPLAPAITDVKTVVPSIKVHPKVEKLEPISTTFAKRQLEQQDQESRKRMKFSCATCQVEMTERYHCTKQNLDICQVCYSQGRFPSSLHSGDFVKMETQVEGNLWTSQERLLLLEGVEMYDDDWGKIAEHVGSKTRDQCVLEFLQVLLF